MKDIEIFISYDLHFKVDPVPYDVIFQIMNFVTVTNYHFYDLFLLQIQ